MASARRYEPPSSSAPDRSIERGAPERAVAWLVTGPLGHLYGAVADIAVYAARRAGERGVRPSTLRRRKA